MTAVRVRRFWRWSHVAAVTALAALSAPAPARADAIVAPPDGTFLTGWSLTELSFIRDGASQTIAFTETTRVSVCFDGVGVQGATGANPIQDGSSNTIQFGESGLPIRVGRITDRRPLSQIADGNSNTIIIGEILPDSFCLSQGVPIAPGTIQDGSSNTIVFDEDSSFDVCVDNARVGITDGSSNTIVFGEPVGRTCFENVGVREGAVPAAVPEPATLTLLLAGMGAATLARRRR